MAVADTRPCRLNGADRWRDPGAGDILLVIEVADSSLRYRRLERYPVR